MNLIELLDNAAARWPDKPAFIEDEQPVSYRTLAERTLALVPALAGHGVAAGQRVGVHFPNSVTCVALTFALWKLRVVVIPLAVECTDAERATIIESLGLHAVIGSSPVPGAHALADNCFLALLDSVSPAENHGIDIAFIRFTSGTTSTRKGVALSHETICDRVRVANNALGVGPADTVIWCLPMAHHFLVTITLYVAYGATVVLARHVLAEPYLAAIQRWQGTVLYASPFHFGMLARLAGGGDIPSVRLAVSTTCSLTHDVATAFRARFGIPVSQALGVIEAGLVCLNTDRSGERWNSVGRPVAGFEAKVLSPDETGAGELAIRGPGMFDAYAAPWMPRELVAPDGWFLTGDIARFDADGYLYLLSRKTAVINLAGRKVFPEEIETVLNRHPAVRESRAYGRPHPHLGEVIEAELVLEGDASALDSIRAHCRAHLASYKIPSRLNIVTALPRTSVTGKIRREPVAAV